MKTVTLTGPFTELDLTELLHVLRRIEQRQPDKEFLMAVDSKESESTESIKQRLMRMFPTMKNMPVEYGVWERKDEDKK